MFTKYADVDGHAIHYVHSGSSTLPDALPDLDDGELLVFLHAAGGTAGLWHPQIAHFGGVHSALALDLPGHGRSSGVDGLRSIADCTALLAAFAERLRLRPFVSIGRSMGGAIALTYALDHPGRVRALVLVCAAVRFEIASAQLQVLHDVVRGRLPRQFTNDAFSPKTGMDVARVVWEEEVRTDPRVAYTDVLACQAFDVGPRLAELRVPTLVVAGADDRTISIAAAEELAGSISGAELVVIEDAGHVVPVEQPGEFHRVVGDFLGRLQ